MLDIHKKSLETVQIDGANLHSIVGLDLQRGLGQFTALRKSACPLHMLLHPDQDMMISAKKLPPSLCEFYTKICRHEGDFGLLGYLENLSHVYKQHTPYPKFVRLDCAEGSKTMYAPVDFSTLP
jgi:hypothetical protein